MGGSLQVKTPKSDQLNQCKDLTNCQLELHELHLELRQQLAGILHLHVLF